MVNGINRPPKVLADHAALGERLAESNRQLAAMQASHRQLLLEMEALRQHAGELQNQTQANRANQTPAAQEVTQPSPEVAQPAPEVEQPVSETVAQPTPEPVTEISPPEMATPAPASTELPAETPVTVNEDPTPAAPSASEEHASEEGDPEEAKYLSAQLAKIAALKTQYERVRHLIETTQKIEEKINKNDDNEEETQPQQLQQMQDELKEQMHKVEANTGGVVPEAETVKQITNEANKDIKMAATPTPTTQMQQPVEKDLAHENFSEELAAATAAATEAALGNADLRTQAEELRSERDRLLALKAELLKRKGIAGDKTQNENNEK